MRCCPRRDVSLKCATIACTTHIQQDTRGSQQASIETTPCTGL
jgi:hypothetical protein